MAEPRTLPRAAGPESSPAVSPTGQRGGIAEESGPAGTQPARRRRGPELPPGRGARAALIGLGALAAAKAAALVVLMGALAAALSTLAAGQPIDVPPLLWQGLAGAVVLGGSVWGQQVLARRAALGTKEELRAALVAKRLDGGPATGADGAQAMVASRGLDGLDSYFSAYLPALVTAAVLPLMIGARILLADWVSALIVVLTIGLVPLFMVLIGLHTQERVAAAAAGLDRLSSHLLELARGLPVLVGLRRANAQREALRDVSEQYRRGTMDTLKTAFLSSLALELISTISVAVVAVFIGVRLVYGQMPLEAGLLALMLAPECFRPFREVGAAHHASEDGVEALRRVRVLLADGDGAAAPPRGGAAGVFGSSGAHRAAVDSSSHSETSDGGVRVEGLTVRYADRSEPAVRNASFTIPARGAHVLDTPSGSGKSTVLAVLAGTLCPGPGVAITGTAAGAERGRTVYAAQHPLFTEATVVDELRLYGGGPRELPVTDEQIDAVLASVNAHQLGERAPTDCSPGELRRAAVARALLRCTVDPEVRLALFDEPTAHLDPASADAVRSAIAALHGSTTVLVATHDRVLAALLDGGIRTAAGTASDDAMATGRTGSAAAHGADDLSHGGVAASTTAFDEELRTTGHHAPAGQKAGSHAGASPHDCRPTGSALPGSTLETAGPDASPSSGAAGPDASKLRWHWLAWLPLRSPRFAAGVVLSSLATLSGAALAGLSGWLIVEASERPPMLYLMSLIVGVRFFGISRSVLRYCERLLTHDAVLRWASTLRLRLWDSLGASIAHWGRLTRSGGALGTLVADVDELRDAVPRAVLPLPAAVLSYAAILVAVGLLVPSAVPVVLVAGVLSLVLLPLAMLAAERRSSAAAAVHRSWLAERTTTLFAAAGSLSANSVGRVLARRFAETDLRVSAPARRAAWAAGMGQGGVFLLTGAAAVAVVLAGAGEGADPKAVAVAALLMLALAEPLGSYLEAVLQLPVLTAMMRRTMPILDAPATVLALPAAGAGGSDEPARRVASDTGNPAGSSRSMSGAARESVDALTVQGLAASYPGQPGPVFTDVDGGAERGQWWVVAGPSGSGKSTLLAVLLGFLAPERGRYALHRDGGAWVEPYREPAEGAALLGSVAWCPQDAYLFNSTLRSNLALARPASDAPGDGELESALATVGLGDWYAGLPDGLSTRVGPGGHHLSGGQRQRVSAARALLAGAAVVLLDEPTAHLGADEAHELVADLKTALADSAVVLVTHDAALAQLGDVSTMLAQPAGYTSEVRAMGFSTLAS
ncbi:thiol reductant ABC exporter subunit CydC [Arthrobacter sp. 35W]|uniref:thiol reductant ABC exporter subunit CydC n=1 Tax=Arthrobacter sp. 35W TaxID=1132441 RepID=UPI000402CEEE|nr:thiol reductant ABC exporter subunit CydC [Arthrobacter sp. 35W]